MNSYSSSNLRNKSFPALIALLLGGAALAPACGGDDNPIPSPTVSGGTGGTTGGSGGKSNNSGGSSGESDAGEGPSEGGTGNEGTGATGGTGANGGNGGTGNNGKGGSGNRGGTGNNQGGEGAEGNQGGEGNQPGVDCEVRGPNNCYRCTPQALDPAPEFPHSVNEQFLNQCDDSKGARFVNEERIPGFTGTLPTLP